MNAVNLLKQQHEEVRDLFEQFEQAEDATDQDAICQKLADNIAAHMIIEERIFYPAAFGAMNSEERMSHALAEHQEAKQLLAEILDMDMSLGGEEFESKMKLLQEKIEQHVEEEENEVFKETRKVLGNDALKRLGVQMQEMFDQLMAGEPSDMLNEESQTARL